MKCILAFTFLFLYSPILILVIYSFNDSRRNIVWRGFTFKYYFKAWNDERLIEAFVNSLCIAFASTIVSTILGVFTALFLWKFRFRFKPFVEGLFALPLVIPEICLGIALLIFFTSIGWSYTLPWPISLGNIIIAHITFSYPFAAVIIRSRLEGFNRELGDASHDLGANQWQTFCFITLPYLAPAIVASMLLTFTLSLDDFVITFFTSGPETLTLPVKIFSMIRFSVTPVVNAASTVLIVVTLVTTFLSMLFMKKIP